MDINYELYRVFYHVATTLSFSEASKQLFISQSAVSQQIAALEKELGVTLLLRDRKGNVSLTPEGEAFYEGCVQVIQSYIKTLMRVKSLQDGERRTICMGLVSGADSGWLPEVTGQLETLVPDVRVKPFYDNFTGLRRGLMGRRYDAAMAIEYALNGLPNVKYETLLELKPKLVVSRNHRLANRTSVRSDEIQEEYFVTMSREHGAESFIHWMKERQKEGLHLKHVETVESAEAQRMMVEMNNAVAILPLLPRFEKYDMDRFRAIDLADSDETVRYLFAYREEEEGETMQTFIRLTREAFQKEQ